MNSNKNKNGLINWSRQGYREKILELLIKEKVIVYAVTRNKSDFKNLKKK